MNLIKSDIKTNIEKITFEYADGLFYYDKNSGNLTRKITTGPRSIAGSIAGNINRDGYIHIGINKVVHKAHRIVFLIMTGRHPVGQIDHINGNRSDNRWENLREASQAENSKNKCLQVNNSSGLSGVAFRKDQNRWMVRISNIYIGSYFDLFSAACARKRKEIEMSYHNNHGRESSGYILNNTRINESN